jgi:hypothetical protein
LVWNRQICCSFGGQRAFCLVEAAAASRVAAKYLHDDEKALKFKAIEIDQYDEISREYTHKASTGRIKAHD